MDDGYAERIRSFNRTVGRTIGALDDHFLGRDRPMGESRVLWEIGDGLEVAELRRRLGLDAGYVSRLLRSLQRQGLIVVGVGDGDRRARRVTPTPMGTAEQSELESAL